MESGNRRLSLLLQILSGRSEFVTSLEEGAILCEPGSVGSEVISPSVEILMQAADREKMTLVVFLCGYND